MSKRDAKRWACSMSADLVHTEITAGNIPSEDEPDREAKKKAMLEIVRELKRRAGE